MQLKKATFRDIEDSVNLQRFRSFYIWASEYFHPNLSSLTSFEMDGKIVVDKITQQQIDKEAFIDPMQLTLAVFHEVNAEFMKLYIVQNEYDINLLLFRRVFESLLETFD